MTLKGLTVVDAEASSQLGTAFGGGIFAFGGKLTVQACTFNRTTAIGGAGAAGGGMYAMATAEVHMTDTSIELASASTQGGGLAVYPIDNAVTLSNVTLSESSAPQGAVIYASSGAKLLGTFVDIYQLNGVCTSLLASKSNTTAVLRALRVFAPLCAPELPVLDGLAIAECGRQPSWAPADACAENAACELMVATINGAWSPSAQPVARTDLATPTCSCPYGSQSLVSVTQYLDPYHVNGCQSLCQMTRCEIWGILGVSVTLLTCIICAYLRWNSIQRCLWQQLTSLLRVIRRHEPAAEPLHDTAVQWDAPLLEWDAAAGQQHWHKLIQEMTPFLANEDKIKGALDTFRGGHPMYVLSTRFEDPSMGASIRMKKSIEAGVVEASVEPPGPSPCFNPNTDNQDYAPDKSRSYRPADRWLLVWMRFAKCAKDSGGCVIQLLDTVKGLSPMQIAEEEFARSIQLEVLQISIAAVAGVG